MEEKLCKECSLRDASDVCVDRESGGDKHAFCEARAASLRSGTSTARSDN